MTQDEAVTSGLGHVVGVDAAPDASESSQADAEASARALARRQASRIAELEHELARVKLAAEVARARVLEEAARRIGSDMRQLRLEQQLESIYATKLWRYSVSARRWYARARYLVGESPRRVIPMRADEHE